MFFLSLPILVFSQKIVEERNFTKIDNIVRSYGEVASIDDLHQKIAYDFDTDLERICVVYTWTVWNLNYEDSSLHKAPKFSLYY